MTGSPVVSCGDLPTSSSHYEQPAIHIVTDTGPILDNLNYEQPAIVTDLGQFQTIYKGEILTAGKELRCMEKQCKIEPNRRVQKQQDAVLKIVLFCFGMEKS